MPPVQNEPKPNRTLAFVVAFVFAGYGLYALVSGVRWLRAGPTVEATITKLQGSFVPGSQVYFSQFGLTVNYRYVDPTGTAREGVADTLGLSFHREGARFALIVDAADPTRSFPLAGVYFDLALAGLLLVLSGLLIRLGLQLPASS